MELVRSISSKKRNILSGSIYYHLISQGIWGVRWGAAVLFGARTRSIMNSIGSWISGLGSNEAEEEQVRLTLTVTAMEGEKG